MKDESIKQKILECAKAEFMEKGFADASMRTIAEKAGFTTGILYSRFADKDEIFRGLVDDGASELYDYFCFVQDEFASFEPARQKAEMHDYVERKVDYMIDIIYKHFDAFKLIICKSRGSSYESYVDKMVEIETRNTVRFIEVLRNMGISVTEVRADLNHMLASALFVGMFEIVAHDFPKEDAGIYVKQLQEFFNAGWDKLLGLS